MNNKHLSAEWRETTHLFLHRHSFGFRDLLSPDHEDVNLAKTVIMISMEKPPSRVFIQVLNKKEWKVQ